MKISFKCHNIFNTFFCCDFQVSFQQTFEQKRSTHLQELQQKEDEMRQMFVLRVKEKEAELKEAEKEVIFLYFMYDIILLNRTKF